MKRRIVLAKAKKTGFGGRASRCDLVSCTVTTRGEQAVRAMDAEERAAFAQLSLITREMRADQVYQVLGPPSEDLILVAKGTNTGNNLQSASCQLCQRAPGQCSLAETRIIHV
ncbi:MAG: hypothetical protein IPN40_10895 [Uliginosibacterium sp.]|nr:hypothetical protein [Uliginosibacterium sp.]